MTGEVIDTSAQTKTPGMWGELFNVLAERCLLLCDVQIGTDEWNACAFGGGEKNPFLAWEFLAALEDSGSAVREKVRPHPKTLRILGVSDFLFKF